MSIGGFYLIQNQSTMKKIITFCWVLFLFSCSNPNPVSVYKANESLRKLLDIHTTILEKQKELLQEVVSYYETNDCLSLTIVKIKLIEIEYLFIESEEFIAKVYSSGGLKPENKAAFDKTVEQIASQKKDFSIQKDFYFTLICENSLNQL